MTLNQTEQPECVDYHYFFVFIDELMFCISTERASRHATGTERVFA
jgi:hypothetical protein